jgi:MoxR-like ATPase
VLSQAETLHARERIDRLLAELGRAILGQRGLLELVVISLLARGHLLLEGLPGLGKTELIKSLSKLLGLSFRRVQFTPDLLPGDIIGSPILEEVGGRRQLMFHQGPIFANLVLADEINRASPKTQSALLEAMQERRVTVLGETHPLPLPFYVLATQNPIELEGTYPLPEAQLDRFMFNIPVTYPTPEEEAQIVKSTTSNASASLEPILSAEEVLRLQVLVRGVPVANDVVDFAVAISNASRPEMSVKKSEDVHKFIRFGASPRASQYLILGAKARALLLGRFHVDFDDVRAVAPPVLRHRLMLNFHARAEGIDVDEIIRRVLAQVRSK